MPLGRPAVSPEIVALFREAHRELEAKGLLELLDDELEHTPCDQCGQRPRYRNAA